MYIDMIGLIKPEPNSRRGFHHREPRNYRNHWNLELRTRNLELRTLDSRTKNQKPVTFS